MSTLSTYDYVLSVTPTGMKVFVQSFMDSVMPKVLAYLMFTWALIGFYYLFKLGYLVLSSIWMRLLRPSKNLKYYGAWAVVTGSTDGIGEAIALELAKKGLNIVLISRSKDKLVTTATKITSKYPKVLVKTIDVDYSNFDEAAKTKVEDELKNLDIGVLINNVGISYQFPKYFHELDDERVDQLISVNINSTTLMTRIVLPGFVKKRKGAIVNISSSAGVAVSPLLSQYSAAKSYVCMLSKALHVELADYGVHVQVQIPLFVTTKLAKIKRSSLFVPTPAVYARAAVACIGYEAEVSPFWGHALQLFILSFIPEWIMEAWIIKQMHYGIRKAGLKKEAKANAAKSS
jgi:17beta-estradiol 17-dehydrogenase / very-long-chain 3-oxoacyl-CoA reductase